MGSKVTPQSSTSPPSTTPVKAADYHRLSPGAGSCYHELFLRRVPAVVKGLDHMPLLPVGHNLLVTASSHNAVRCPCQGVRGTGVDDQLALGKKRRLE